MIGQLEKIIDWNKEDYLNFILKLKEYQDIEYREFYIKIIKSEVNIIGVRDPILKDIAKILSKSHWENFIKQVQHIYYEESIIHGYIIGYAKMGKEEHLKYLDEFVTYIDNWALCDAAVASFKFIKKEREFFFNYVKQYCFNENNWIKRAGIVMLLKFYLVDDYIDEVIEICSKIDVDNYYVDMARAWLLSEIFVKYEDKILILFDENILPANIQNKAIQKIKDSSRVSTEQKILINMFTISK